jgi:hypothetical protein
MEVLQHEDERSPAREGPEQAGGRREHGGQLLGFGLRVMPLHGGTQAVGLRRARPLGVEPGEEVAEHGERDAVVEVVSPADHHGVTELPGRIP